MADTAAQNYISLEQLQSCGYAMITLTSIFALARIGIRVWRPKALAVEDVLVFLAYASFMTMAALYTWTAPTLFKLTAVVAGQAPPYAELPADGLLIIKAFFTNTILLWVILWLVKGSLLALYWRLLSTKRIYIYLWWAIVVFCATVSLNNQNKGDLTDFIKTFIGCVVSHLTSCSSMTAWFTPGACGTARDQRAQIISLYYAFAVDVLSDIMIMALPLALIWNLQLAFAKKVGIAVLFCIGIFAIAAAVVRVVSIGVRAQNATPSSSWLAFWGMIESGIAVIIGTAPGLYTSARRLHQSYKDSRYAGSSGYRRQGESDVTPKYVISSKKDGSLFRSVDDDNRAILDKSFMVSHRSVPEDYELDEGSPNSRTPKHRIQVTQQFTLADSTR